MPTSKLCWSSLIDHLSSHDLLQLEIRMNSVPKTKAFQLDQRKIFKENMRLTLDSVNALPFYACCTNNMRSDFISHKI